jgi:hypothetical protein
VGSVEREASVKTIWDRLAYVPQAMAHWVDRKKSILGSKSRGTKIGLLRGWGVSLKAENGVSEIEAQNRGRLWRESRRKIKAARRTCLGCGGKGAVFCPLFTGTETLVARHFTTNTLGSPSK